MSSNLASVKVVVEDDDAKVNPVWNTEVIETAELENLISRTAQCLYSGKERHE